MKTWFTITNLATAPAAEIDIFDEIGLWGVTVKDFASSLKAVPMDRDITLRINSPGGSIFDGYAIFNLLTERRDKVTAKVIGLAASMASIIMLAGKRAIASKNATIMIHNPAAVAFGESKDMRDMADLLDKLQGTLVNTYVSKSGKSEADVKSSMDATTWFTADEAKAWGLIDEVIEPVKIAASYDLTRFGAVPQNISGGQTASANQPNKQDNMKNLIKALVDAKLVASIDASEELAVAQFVAAFALVANSVTDANAKVTDLTAKLSAANDSIAASLKASAEVAIEASVKSGRIKDDAGLRAKWLAAYLRDEAGTKAILESLPEAKSARGVAPIAAVTTSDATKEVTGLARTIAAFQADKK
jgi:ATP-dependent Clp endopeptidase proteolytic subunit ClpP